MLTKQEIENILVDNGLAPTAADEEIRSALLRMNWQENDVDAALLVLRENVVTNESRIDAIQSIFYSDAKLNPKTITQLLGIEVDVSKNDINPNQKHVKGSLTFSYLLEIALVSILLSFILAFGTMWILKVGVFHQTML